MDREKFWGTLVAALDEAKMSPELMGKVVAAVATALHYAEEAEG